MSLTSTQILWFALLFATAIIYWAKVVEIAVTTKNRRDNYFRCFVSLGILQGLYSLNSAYMWVSDQHDH